LVFRIDTQTHSA